MKNEGLISVKLIAEEYDRIVVVDLVFAKLGELYSLEQAGGEDVDFLEGMIDDLLQRQLSVEEATCALRGHLKV